MGQTLTNGIFLPNEGERNCYTGLADNWRAIDGYIGNYNVHVADVVIHVSQADRDKWDAVDNKADASALTAHTGNTTIHVTAADKEAWNGKADASALTAHTGDTTIHVTAEDKTKWDAVTSKADASALTAHTGDTTIHVTAADKNTWDAVTTKANDADAVHKSGAETIAGQKTFSTFITSDGSSIGDEYSSNVKTNLWLMGNRDTEEVSGVLFDTFRQNTAQGTGSHILGIGIKENAVRYEGCRFAWSWDNNLNGYSFSIRPTLQGTNQAVKHNLGISTDKWDTINGVAPGLMSFPDISAAVDISAYISVTNGQNIISTYTAPADGWISINLGRPSGAVGLIISNGSYAISGRDNSFPDAHRECPGILPVFKNDTVTILSSLADSVLWAYFYPCMGNV